MLSWFTVVIGKKIRHLVYAHSMQFCTGYLAIEPFPNCNRYVFSRRDQLSEFRHFFVQMSVVIYANDLALHYIFQLLQINYKPRSRVDVPSNGYLDCVVVSVAILIGALAKDTFVFLRRPCLVPVIVRGRKLSFSRQ